MSVLGAIGKFLGRKANNAIAKNQKKKNVKIAYNAVGKQIRSGKKVNGTVAYKKEKKRLDQKTESNRRDVEAGINDI